MGGWVGCCVGEWVIDQVRWWMGVWGLLNQAYAFQPKRHELAHTAKYKKLLRDPDFLKLWVKKAFGIHRLPEVKDGNSKVS